jgi:putative FmdB family regulatory protein
MPVYEYVCPSCGQEFERLVRSMDSRERVNCPECGGSKVKRKLSVFAARQGAAARTPASASPCGRCGDPNGSCSV